MSGAIASRAIREAVLEGIYDALESHKRMSEGSRRGFTEVPEYFVTTKIAERLVKAATGCSVELEMPVKDTMELACALKPGQVPDVLAGNRRFDIVLWWKTRNGPRAIIEVKHGVRGFINLERDVRRICEALKRADGEKCLQFGCVAFFLHTSKRFATSDLSQKQLMIARTKIGEAAKRIGTRMNCAVRILSDAGQPRLVESENKTRSGQACCLMIRRLRKSERTPAEGSVWKTSYL